MSNTFYFRYLQSLSCEFFLVGYPESRSGKPPTFSKHIFLLIYRKSSNMRIMNTPTAERNPIASGDTKRNREGHIIKNQSIVSATCRSFYICQNWLLVNTTNIQNIYDITEISAFPFEYIFNTVESQQLFFFFQSSFQRTENMWSLVRDN